MEHLWRVADVCLGHSRAGRANRKSGHVRYGAKADVASLIRPHLQVTLACEACVYPLSTRITDRLESADKDRPRLW